MKKGVLITVISLIGFGLTTFSLAGEPGSLQDDTQMLLGQYEALKAQSLALIDTVKNLQEDRQKLTEQEKALKGTLEESKKARHELEDQYIVLLETVRTLKADRRTLMTDQTLTQKMAGALKGRVEALERKQTGLDSEINKTEQAYETEQAKLKEAVKKIKGLQKAFQASEQANIDLQMQVAEMQSLSRESRLAFNYELGRLYTEHGKYDAAIAQFQKTLDLDPNYAEAYRQLGAIYREHLARTDLASPYFRRYLELRPEAGDFERIQGWLIKTKREIDTKREAEQWGDGFFHNLGRIFF